MPRTKPLFREIQNIALRHYYQWLKLELENPTNSKEYRERLRETKKVIDRHNGK